MAGAELVPVTLVVGPEELLAARAVTEVVAGARAAYPDVDVRDVSAAALEPGDVSQLTSASLFAERILLVVRDVQDASEPVLRALSAVVSDPPPELAVVLTFPKRTRGFAVLKPASGPRAREIDCAAPKSRAERVRFLEEEFRSHGRRPTPEALDIVLSAVGSNLAALAAAAAQLHADVEGGLDEDAVRRYYEGRVEVSGFVVADRAVEGRAAEALRQLRYALVSPSDRVLVIAALAMALRNIVKVASASRGLRDADLAREVGLPPWKVATVRKQSRGWSAEGVARALTAVAAADAAVKGGEADPSYAVEKAVVAVAHARGAQ